MKSCGNLPLDPLHSTKAAAFEKWLYLNEIHSCGTKENISHCFYRFQSLHTIKSYLESPAESPFNPENSAVTTMTMREAPQRY